jgi:hypothetical protein
MAARSPDRLKAERGDGDDVGPEQREQSMRRGGRIRVVVSRTPRLE